MGCFNATCSISGLPIVYNDEVTSLLDDYKKNRDEEDDYYEYDPLKNI